MFDDDGAISEPRIDGVDTNIQAAGRLVYFVTANGRRTLRCLNAGQDSRFGLFNNVNDDFRGLISAYNQSQKQSLRIAQSLITFEETVNIYTHALCA